MTLRYPQVRHYLYGSAWAILPEKLAAITEFIAIKAHGGEISAEEIQTQMQAAAGRQAAQATDRVAVLPIVGTIAHRADLMSEFSGGTSVETLSKQFRALVNDPAISAIVLDVDSPGGNVSGIDEFATEIYRARGTKPITAVANTMAASAAYWLASAADEIVVTPSGSVGSIGVIAAHEDDSALYEQMGVKVSLITAGKYKAENNPFEPMTDEGRAAIQKRVDESYATFTRTVARNRGVPVDDVRSGFGEGRMIDAREAVSLGMADRIATIDDVVATIGRKIPQSTSGTEANAGLVLVPYEEHGQRVLADLSLFVEATRDRIAHRQATRAGYTLSHAQRGRLLGISGELLALIEMTEPVQSASIPVGPFRARLQELTFILAGVYG